MKAKLINNEFEFIKYTGKDSEEEFEKLKNFCKEDVNISYEYALGIGYFWLITLDDCLKNSKVTVPIGDYILKLANGFTLISNIDFCNNFCM